MFPNAKWTRRLFAWHKWTGLIGGVFVLFLIFTGTVAVFKNEIDWLVTPAKRVAPKGDVRSLDEMLGNVERDFPGKKIDNLSFPEDSETAFTFQVEGKGEDERLTIFVNPYTAEITGTRSGETLANVIRQTHVRFYYFGANGRIAVGVFGLLMFVSALTGIFIYAPFMKGVFARKLRFWQIRQDNLKVKNSDWHKLIGLITLVFNLILGLTGAVLGLENLAPYHKPTQALIHPRPLNEKELAPPSTLENRLSVDRIIENARNSLPGFAPKSINFPKAGKNHFVVYGNITGRFERAGASFMVLDTASGAVLQTHNAALVPRVTWLYNLNEPLHFGDFSGAWLKWTYFVFGLAASALTVTGLWLWLLKRWKKKIKTA
jgi:uncharacterized iron-regulated membrane protein